MIDLETLGNVTSFQNVSLRMRRQFVSFSLDFLPQFLNKINHLVALKRITIQTTSQSITFHKIKHWLGSLLFILRRGLVLAVFFKYGFELWSLPSGVEACSGSKGKGKFIVENCRPNSFSDQLRNVRIYYFP